jgi:hypothetical protein
MRRRLPLVLVALGLLVLLGLVGARAALLQRHEAAEGGAAFPPAHVDALLADVKRLQGELPFGECRITRDAGVVLNPLVSLDDNVHVSATPPWWADPAVEKALRTRESSWRDHVEDGPRGDLSVTKVLLDYDGWDSMASGPGAALLAEGIPPGTPMFEIGIPNMVPFLTLARLRLLEGLRTGDMLPALQEVRHLATLVHCEETLVGQVVATTVLGIEADGYTAAVARGILLPDAWTPIAKDVREALRRTAFGLAGLYAGWAPEGTLERLDAIGGPLHGRCGAIAAAVEQWTQYRPYVGAPWPYEPDHRGPVLALDRALAAAPCRLPQVRAYWAAPESESAWLTAPYVRDHAFHGLFDIGPMNFDQYGATP